MSARILINLAVVLAVFIGFSIWALNTIISLDVYRNPFTVTARFPHSPGLARDFEVTYLGVRVGKVNSVRLVEDGAEVELAIDRGAEIPGNVLAQVARKSAIGEPYVNFSLPGGGPRGENLAQGDRVPVDRESKVMDYQRLFSRLDSFLSAAPPEDVGTIVDEMHATLDGRGETIRNIIEDSAQISDTFSKNSEVLDGASEELTKLTRILAGEKFELAGGVNNFAQVSKSLKASRKEVANLLKESPGLLESVEKLMKDARPDISCALRTAGTPNAPLLGPEMNRNLSKALGDVPTLVDLVNDITVKRPEGTYARNTFVISLTDPIPAEEYQKGRKLPKAPKLTNCSDIVPNYRPAGSGDETAKDKDNGKEPADAGTERPGRAEPQGTSSPIDVRDAEPAGVTTAEAEVSRLLPLLPPLGGVAVLVWVLGAIVGTSMARRRAASSDE